MSEVVAGMISLADPVLGEAEKEALCRVIDSGWLTMGQRVAEFESRFAAMHGRDAAVAVSSCTAALHLALAALGVGDGDEVLLPSMTFVATANAVRYVGAQPVFVDIEALDRPLISLEDAEEKVSARTKAVIVVHYAGYLVDMPAWRAFASRHGLKLIEDAAHAPEGAGVDGLADGSAYSFFTNKNMTTAEGGMLLARDSAVLERARRMRSHGMTTLTLDRDRGHAFSYDVVELGYNYRLDELRAALGLAQLERLASWNQARRERVCWYERVLAGVPVTVPFADVEGGDAHLMPVLLPEGIDRVRIMQRLREAGVQSSIHYPPIHTFSTFRTGNTEVPRTERYGARVLTLPLHPGLSEKDVSRVVGALEEALSCEA